MKVDFEVFDDDWVFDKSNNLYVSRGLLSGKKAIDTANSLGLDLELHTERGFKTISHNEDLESASYRQDISPEVLNKGFVVVNSIWGVRVLLSGLQGPVKGSSCRLPGFEDYLKFHDWAKSYDDVAWESLDNLGELVFDSKTNKYLITERFGTGHPALDDCTVVDEGFYKSGRSVAGSWEGIRPVAYKE